MKTKLKTYVLMSDPCFEEKILSGEKIHTLRQNYDWWKKRIKAINRGEGILSIRVWEGKPYHSHPREIKRLEKVGLQRIVIWHNEPIPGAKMPPDFYINKKSLNCALLYERFLGYQNLVINDGFETADDFREWFFDYPDGVMALIHFTDFRY